MVSENDVRVRLHDTEAQLQALSGQIPPLQQQVSSGTEEWAEALEMLASYPWPGNVRELMSVTTMGYALADGMVIEPGDLVAHFQADAKSDDDSSDHFYRRVAMEGGSFWDTVYTPFMERELNRAQVRSVLKRALTQADGSYRRALDVLRIAQSDYQRLMDFLRHHNLKP